MEKCVHCNERHGIYEEWAQCNEKRTFDANLDKWARDMAYSLDEAAIEEEVRERVYRYASR